MSAKIDLLPPQDLNAERCALGACMISRLAFPKIAELLNPESYYRQAHRYVWESFVRLAGRGDPIDLQTVSAELTTMRRFEEIGGSAYLVELTEVVPTAANVESYARTVADKFDRRCAIEEGVALVQRAHEDESLGPALADTTTALLRLQSSQVSAKRLHTVRELMDEFVETLDEGPTQLRSGISSGFRNIDRVLGLLRKSYLYFLGGGPGSGKTTLAMQIAHYVARVFGPVLFVSMEIGRDLFCERLVCFESQTPGRVVQYGPQNVLDESLQRLYQGVSRIVDRPLYVAFGNHTTAQVSARAKEVKQREGRLALVVTDRLEYFNDPDTLKLDETRKVTALTPRIKAINNEVEAPVICLAQLHRAGQDSEEPRMADFRASGTVENDGQGLVILKSDKSRARSQLHVVKNSGGGTGPCDEMQWRHWIPMFAEDTSAQTPENNRRIIEETEIPF